MPHPGIAVLQALIAEEEANIISLQEQYDDLMAEHSPGSTKSDFHFLLRLTDCITGKRNSGLVIKFAQIQLAALPQSW